MPDTRSHRGPHPEDALLFGPEAEPLLRQAVVDLSWLLTRGYATTSALKLVGDRYQLSARQRIAVARCACSDQDAARRETHRVGPEALRQRELWIDGYNVLTSVEAALAGGVILAARDGTFRDMASMHGTYRKVAETRPALQCIGSVTSAVQAGRCLWLLDRAVSNSGRLKQIILQVAQAADWPWEVALVDNPDPILRDSPQIVATADSAILDHCRAWFNLARETIAQHIPQAWIFRTDYFFR